MLLQFLLIKTKLKVITFSAIKFKLLEYVAGIMPSRSESSAKKKSSGPPDLDPTQNVEYHGHWDDFIHKKKFKINLNKISLHKKLTFLNICIGIVVLLQYNNCFKNCVFTKFCFCKNIDADVNAIFM